MVTRISRCDIYFRGGVLPPPIGYVPELYDIALTSDAERWLLHTLSRYPTFTETMIQ